MRSSAQSLYTTKNSKKAGKITPPSPKSKTTTENTPVVTNTASHTKDSHTIITAKPLLPVSNLKSYPPSL